jgi:signal transduction histidine kinase/CheY-like chemotaxis protein
MEKTKHNTPSLKQLIDEAAAALKDARTPEEKNLVVESLIKRALGAEFASLWIFNSQKAALIRNRNDGTPREISMLSQQGVLARCFFTMQGGIFNYLASEKGYVPQVDNPDNIRIKSKIIVPIVEKESFLGMVTAYNSVRNIKNFTQEDMRTLEALVPFFKQAIYEMHPDLYEKNVPDVYVSERLKKELEKAVDEIDNTPDSKEEKTTSAAPQATVASEKTVSASEKQIREEMMMFLANTVHDIRTPANTLYGFLELLEDKMEGSPLLSYIKNAKESARFINELTTTILDKISSEKEGKKVEEEKPVSLNPAKFFVDIAESFSANMYGKHIAYTIYVDPMLPRQAELYAVTLKRVLMNLLSNAYKFTPERHSVDFAVRYDMQTGRLKISVDDTGIGIPKEKQAEIFEAFKQAESDTKEKYGGTGLGLSITAAYVKRMGGTLKLESEIDEGSRFSFDIPLKATDATPQMPPLPSVPTRIGIIHSRSNLPTTRNIARYVMRFGLDKKSLVSVRRDGVKDADLTHLICFAKFATPELVEEAKKRNLPLLVVEESMFEEENDRNYDVVSRYRYYGKKLYDFILEGHSPRILIADDDKINVELIRAIFEEDFCTVEVAHDGEEALKMMQNALWEGNPYFLVFLDKHMPHRSGKEVLDIYRKDEHVAGVPPLYAVSITGDAACETEAVFDACVNKPFSPKRIKACLEEANNRRKKED